MCKRCLAFIAFLLLLVSTGHAAPLTNFGFGHLSADADLDLSYLFVRDVSINGSEFSPSAFNGFSPGYSYAVTVGVYDEKKIGGFAVQLKNSIYNGPTNNSSQLPLIPIPVGPVSYWASGAKVEYNLVYQLPVNSAVTAQVIAGVDSIASGITLKTDTNSILSELRGEVTVSGYGIHGGVLINYALGPEFNLFGNAEYGTLFWGAGIGASYTPIDHLDINIGCRYEDLAIKDKLKIDGIIIPIDSINASFVEPYIGITVRL
ncbi:MAG: hypothetical protein WCP79_09670 [Bacillota bacterium]